MSVRAFWLFVMIALVVTSAVGVIFARQESRQAFAELSTLERDRDELNFQFGRLQLEQATWAEANRIEQVASERIGMKFPVDAEIEVVQP
jgi:cell division protein FtsL